MNLVVVLLDVVIGFWYLLLCVFIWIVDDVVLVLFV